MGADLQGALSRLVRVTLDAVLPPRCLGCGARDRWLCADCADRLPPLPAAHCRVCAASLPGVAVCPACYRRRPSFDKVAAPYLHHGLARDLVHALKYRGHRHVAPILAGAMAGVAPPDVDVVIAVPLHRGRRRERGFNQSELLARAAAGRLGLPLRLDALRRERPTRPQVELAHDERAANVLGAFVTPARLEGTRVLLVDDVCTTGATLDACAAALKRAGASEVDCLVATRASTTRP